jgi:hypothetical protein
LGLVKIDVDQRGNCLGRLGYRRRNLEATLAGGPGEYPVGDAVLVDWSTDTYAQSSKRRGPEHVDNGPQTIVTGEASPHFALEATGREIQVVVHHDEVLEVLE